MTHIVHKIARFAMMPHWLGEMRRFTKELESEHGEHFQGLGKAVKTRIEFFTATKKHWGLM